MSEDSTHDIILRDVYLVTHVFSTPPADIKRKPLRYYSYALPGVTSHYSLLTQNHVFHITSEFAQKKSAYFKGVIQGQANVPLLLKFADLSAGERDNTVQYRAVYCGQTPYRISHIEFYARFVMGFFDHYSLTFANCLNYAIYLAALIINREGQAFTDPFRNGPFIGTLEELTIEETRRETVRQTGQRLPLCRAGMLNLKCLVKVWRIQGLMWVYNLDPPIPRLCPLAESPEYGIFPSINNIHGKRRGMRRFHTFRLDNARQLMRNYKNTSRWYVEWSPGTGVNNATHQGIVVVSDAVTQ